MARNDDNRTRALTTSRYLQAILSSVLGHPAEMRIQMNVATARDDRQIAIVLTLDDAHALAEALNREPEVK